MSDSNEPVSEQSPTASSPAAASPAKRANLPWVLVAMLSVLSLGLGTMLASRTNELNALRAQSSVQATAAPAGGASAAATTAGAQTPDPEVVKLLESLPRRKEGDPFAQGKVDAPVVLIEWSDWRCPFCAVWAQRTLPALQPYIDNGTLRIEYRDLQIFGDQSINTARGARAAGAQGKFWEYYHAVFDKASLQGHPNYTEKTIEGFAKTAGCDMSQWRKDYDAASTLKTVQTETQEAQQLGISGTPFFVINTTVISGAEPTENFVAAIEKAAAGA